MLDSSLIRILRFPLAAYSYRIDGLNGGKKHTDNTEVFIMLLDSIAIQKILPHRYPFLLVDAIEEMEQWKRIVGIKNVTINEYFFPGHFPGKPIMPGVLIIESMAQTGGLLRL